jgi:ring-1,2-phenylacetyl-CoA epoxidase subunit PaaE
MTKFHSLKVSDVKQETADCVSIAFEIPAELKNDYTFKQGQYLTLKLHIGGEELRRSYSICSSPLTATELRVAVKRVKDGKGSNWLNEKVRPGDQVEVMTPMGNFYTELQSSNQKNYVLLAGGSGVTPMLSIIKAVLATESKSTIQLFYGNQDEAATIFRQELDALAASNKERLQVHYVLNQPKGSVDTLYKGLLDPDKIKNLLTKHVDLNKANEFFICGPTPMMDNARNVLETLKVDKTRVHIEYFTASLEAAKKNTETPTDANIDCSVTVILDSDEHVIQLGSNGPAILDAALDAGIDVPFACKGAVCCTCRAKVVQGKVKMDMNYALSEEEIAKGYVLTCQAHPLTPIVIVDFDAH